MRKLRAYDAAWCIITILVWLIGISLLPLIVWWIWQAQGAAPTGGARERFFFFPFMFSA